MALRQIPFQNGVGEGHESGALVATD